MDRSEQGFTAVFLSLTMVAMLAASAFAIDLGQAYTSRRQMQNAADAAALAGTRALLRAKNPTTGLFVDLSNTVWTTTRNTATDNGADIAQVTCTVVRRDKSSIAPCSPSTGWVADALVGGPAGIMVTAAVTNKTAFARVIKQSTVTSKARATGLIQPLMSAKGAPFLVCGAGDHTIKKSSWPADPLDPDVVSLSLDLLLAGGLINPAAVGHVYGLQGSGSTIATCGTESAFDGKSASGFNAISIPSWQTGTNGNGNDAAIYDTVAGASPCVPPNFSDCDLVLPVADTGAPGYQLHIVAFAVFHVTGNGSGNPKYAGRLLTTTAPVTRGQGGTGNCTLAQACVIKLVS
jgi:Flp pilus assembly protein TadG